MEKSEVKWVTLAVVWKEEERRDGEEGRRGAGVGGRKRCKEEEEGETERR